MSFKHLSILVFAATGCVSYFREPPPWLNGLHSLLGLKHHHSVPTSDTVSHSFIRNTVKDHSMPDGSSHRALSSSGFAPASRVLGVHGIPCPGASAAPAAFLPAIFVANGLNHLALAAYNALGLAEEMENLETPPRARPTSRAFSLSWTKFSLNQKVYSNSLENPASKFLRRPFPTPWTQGFLYIRMYQTRWGPA